MIELELDFAGDRLIGWTSDGETREMPFLEGTVPPPDNVHPNGCFDIEVGTSTCLTTNPLDADTDNDGRPELIWAGRTSEAVDRFAVYENTGVDSYALSFITDLAPDRARDDIGVDERRVGVMVRGRWIPGVSRKTICASGRSRTPRTWLRVVWGLGLTMAIFCPRSWFIKVDLPALGRPTTVT